MNRVIRAPMRWWRRRCRPSDDAGVVLIIWVVALVGLLTMAAMAVDLGNIAQTKEHAETAVQDAALAAVTDLVNLYPGGYASGTTPYIAQEQQAVTDAETYIQDNYSAATNFNSCNGMLDLSLVYLWPSANCIGFFDPGAYTNSGNLNEIYATGIAVALPNQNVAYSFGRAADLKSQAVSAVAYASLRSTGGSTSGVPFGYPVTSGGGLQCLKDASNLSKDPCGGFQTGSGQYGILNSPRFNLLAGYSPSGGQHDAYLQEDVELGIDHQLNVYNPTNPSVVQVCDGVQGNPPGCTYYNATYGTNLGNYANPQSGQTLNIATPALFTGVSPATAPPQGCNPGQVLPPRLEFPNNFQLPSPPTCSNLASAPMGPAQPYLTSSKDEFGQTANLNGVPIAQYLLPKEAQGSGTNLASVYSESSKIGCNTNAETGLFPPSSGSYSRPSDVQTAASQFGLDYQVGTTYLWQSFDVCLSNLIQNGFTSNAPVASPQPPPLETCTTVNNAQSCTPNTNAYGPTTDQYGPIFSADIVDSPRFGYVPIIGTSGNGTGAQQIIDFAGAYLDMAYPQASHSTKMAAIQAWVFPLYLIQGSPSPTVSGYTTPYRGGQYTEALCSVPSQTC